MFRSNIQIILVFIFFAILKSQNIDSELPLVNQYIDRGELKEAEIKLDKNLLTDPTRALGHISYSKIWLRRTELNKETEYANLTVRIDEDFRYWWNELNDFRNKIKTGTLTVHKKDYNTAIKVFAGLTKKYLRYSEPFYLLALAKYKQKSFEASAKFFKQSIDLNPNYQKVQIALINVKNVIVSNYKL